MFLEMTNTLAFAQNKAGQRARRVRMNVERVDPQNLSSEHSLRRNWQDICIQDEYSRTPQSVSSTDPLNPSPRPRGSEWGGAPLKELAERRNLSVSALKNRASRGSPSLKERLLDCCKVDLPITGSVLGYERNRGSEACTPNDSGASTSVACSPRTESEFLASSALSQ